MVVLPGLLVIGLRSGYIAEWKVLWLAGCVAYWWFCWFWLVGMVVWLVLVGWRCGWLLVPAVGCSTGKVFGWFSCGWVSGLPVEWLVSFRWPACLLWFF